MYRLLTLTTNGHSSRNINQTVLDDIRANLSNNRDEQWYHTTFGCSSSEVFRVEAIEIATNHIFELLKLLPQTFSQTPNTSLLSAKKYVAEGLDKKVGHKCPCCHKVATSYRLKLTYAMLKHLTVLGDVSNMSTVNWTHRDKFVFEAGGQFSKMKHWGLIECSMDLKSNDMGDGVYKSNGKMWRLTDIGVLFLNGKIKLSEYVHTYNGELTKYSGGFNEFATANSFM